MVVLKSKTNFASINIGDAIPEFEIGETQETIDGSMTHARIRLSEELIGSRKNFPSVHGNPEQAKKGMFGVTANGGTFTMSYINQMLEVCFPPEAFYNGGSLTYKGVNPFRPGDVVGFTGEVTGKRVESGKNFVDVEIKGIDKTGRLVGVASATLVLS